MVLKSLHTTSTVISQTTTKRTWNRRCWSVSPAAPPTAAHPTGSPRRVWGWITRAANRPGPASRPSTCPSPTSTAPASPRLQRARSRRRRCQEWCSTPSAALCPFAAASRATTSWSPECKCFQPLRAFVQQIWTLQLSFQVFKTFSWGLTKFCEKGSCFAFSV